MKDTKRYTIDFVDLSTLTDKQKELAVMLNTRLYSDVIKPEGSIMNFEQFCHHDDGFLCECRLLELIRVLTEKV